MYRVDVDEAGPQIGALMDAAMRGERVVIARDDRDAVQLVPLMRHAGTARGLIRMSGDFDSPIPDFDAHSA